MITRCAADVMQCSLILQRDLAFWKALEKGGAEEVALFAGQELWCAPVEVVDESVLPVVVAVLRKGLQPRVCNQG